MDYEQRRFGPILVGRWDINENFALLTHRFFLRFERGIVATKDLAVCERHRELEGLSFGIALVGQSGLNFVFGTNGELAVTFGAGIFHIGLSGPGTGCQGTAEADGSKQTNVT